MVSFGFILIFSEIIKFSRLG